MIDALGGTSAVARWLGVGMSAVSNWKAANAIPQRLHLTFWIELRRRRMKVAPSLFGLGRQESPNVPSRRLRRRPGPLGSCAA